MIMIPDVINGYPRWYIKGSISDAIKAVKLVSNKYWHPTEFLITDDSHHKTKFNMNEVDLARRMLLTLKNSKYYEILFKHNFNDLGLLSLSIIFTGSDYQLIIGFDEFKKGGVESYENFNNYMKLLITGLKINYVTDVSPEPALIKKCGADILNLTDESGFIIKSKNDKSSGLLNEYRRLINKWDDRVNLFQSDLKFSYEEFDNDIDLRSMIFKLGKKLGGEEVEDLNKKLNSIDKRFKKVTVLNTKRRFSLLPPDLKNKWWLYRELKKLC